MTKPFWKFAAGFCLPILCVGLGELTVGFVEWSQPWANAESGFYFRLSVVLGVVVGIVAALPDAPKNQPTASRPTTPGSVVQPTASRPTTPPPPRK